MFTKMRLNLKLLTAIFSLTLLVSGFFAFNRVEAESTAIIPTPTLDSAIITDGSSSIGNLNGATVKTQTTGADHVINIDSSSVVVSNGPIPDGDYAFKMMAPSNGVALKAYFAAKGWPAEYLTKINSEIDGASPFFYFRVTDGVYTLVDGFKHSLGQTNANVTIDDNYPAGAYTFKGMIGAQEVSVTLNVVSPKLTISQSNANPSASTVKVSDIRSSEPLMLVFRLKATDSDITLNKISVNLTGVVAGAKTLQDMVGELNLKGSGNTLASTSSFPAADTGTVIFTLDEPLIISDGQSKEFTVYAKIKDIDYFSQGDSLKVDINNVEAKNSQLNTITTTGSANGNTQTFYSEGITVSGFTYGTASVVTDTFGDTTSANFAMSFKVSAFGNNFYIAKNNNLNASSPNASVNLSGLSSSGGATSSGNYWLVSDGDTATFTTTGIISNPSISGFYKINLNSLKYDKDNITGGEVTHILTPATSYETSSIYFTTSCMGISITKSGIKTCYTSIQSAIDAAANGDTIHVGAGTYNEHLTINKSITLKGANFGINGNETRTSESIIDGGSSGVVATIIANNVNLNGFTIKNSGSDINQHAGLGLIGVTGVTIENNIINDNVTGIAVMSSSANTIKNNLISNSDRYGIVLEAYPLAPTVFSTSNIISGNTITNNARDGIYVGLDCNTNTMTKNTITGATGTIESSTGIEGNGIYLWKSSNNIITGNTSSGNVNYGIEMMGSANNTITENIITGNKDGFHIRNSATKSIAGNNISRNKIYSNSRLNLYANPDFDFNIKSNWWGSADRVMIINGLGSWTSDGAITPGTTVFLNYEPWYIDETMTTLSDSIILTVNSVGNGTAGPADMYNYGDVVTLTNLPSEGYRFVNWSGDADCTDGSVTMNKNITCDANFAINKYALTSSAGTNGSITPSETVNHGTDKTFTITPASNYYIVDVIVDNVLVGAVTNYTFTNVTTTHTISATFALPVMIGEVHIDGTTQYGQILTADISGLNLNTHLIYEWTRWEGSNSGVTPGDRTSNTYELGTLDIGKTITVTVKADANFGTGSISSEPTSVITKATQSPLEVTGLPSSATYGQTAEIKASTTGGTGEGTVTFSSGADSSTGCIIDSSTGVVTITMGNGTCSITATKASDANYESVTSAPVSITINKAGQVINFGTLDDKIYGDADFNIRATSSSGSSVTSVTFESLTPTVCTINSSNAIHIVSVGICAIRATKLGDNNYNPASPVEQLFVITDETVPVITMKGATPLTIVQGSTYTDEGAAATDNVDGAVTVTSTGTVNADKVGLYTITYTAKDTAGNTAIPVVRTVTVYHQSSGGSSIPVTPAIPAKKAAPLEDCLAGELFSTITGKNCNASIPASPSFNSNNNNNGKVLGAERYNFTLLLKIGSKGNEVMELQKYLTALGYDLGTADGKFGKKTKAAVIKFQIENGLKGDGVVGPVTRAKLNK